jgi:hypothetical protein
MSPFTGFITWTFDAPQPAMRTARSRIRIVRISLLRKVKKLTGLTLFTLTIPAVLALSRGQSP